MYNSKIVFSSMSIGFKTLPVKSGLWLVYSLILSCILEVFSTVHCLFVCCLPFQVTVCWPSPDGGELCDQSGLAVAHPQDLSVGSCYKNSEDHEHPLPPGPQVDRFKKMYTLSLTKKTKKQDTTLKAYHHSQLLSKAHPYVMWHSWIAQK